MDTDAQPKTDHAAARRRALFEDAAAIVHDEFASRGLGLAQLAHRVGASRRGLQRAFAESAGIPFGAYVRQVRMRRAAELLELDGLQVAQVARSVGYRQHPQFTKAFKRHHGISPTAFAGRHLGAHTQAPALGARVPRHQRGNAGNEDMEVVMTEMTQAYDWRGREVVDREGQKIGTVEELYRDQDSREPEWAAVKTGLFGTKLSFVPIAGAEPAGEQVRVPFEKALVKDAPGVEPDGELSQEEEHSLYSHYGMGYSERRSDSGLPEGGADAGAGRDVSGPTTDDAMTRSEEELRVGTASRERGRARLRKYVVTEHVQRTVPVEREEVRVEREPITDANVDRALDGPDISDEEHEVVLHEEEPVVEKRTVPKERVRMKKDTVRDERQISEEVRRERIEAEGDDGR